MTAQAPWHPLLDLPDLPPDGYGRVAGRIGALLDCPGDVLPVQGEAIIALEAVMAGLARPDLAALVVVTSDYGRWYGDWLRHGGAVVVEVAAEPGRPIAAAAVAAALGGMASVDVVLAVHAESASGILNPLGEIAALARRRGALVVVDAVASVGGHPLAMAADGIDVAVIGPQKALGGSAGLSAVAASARGWAALAAGGAEGKRHSVLALDGLRRAWIAGGRGVLPGMPSALEFRALAAALDRVEAEGLGALIDRHARAARATRAGLSALGVPPLVGDREGSHLVTAARLPDGLAVDVVIGRAGGFGAGLSPAVGEGLPALVRLNHTGRQARFDRVLANVVALGAALGSLGVATKVGAAAEAVAACYRETT